ncbi:MAG: hypothetical protein KTR31_16210 [Myxococcales bacterium]|nr:hypothetical protein [Myxococcales bacterium]
MTPADRILALLTERGVSFEVLEHPHATTALEAASARGTPPAWGGKSIVMKLDRGIGFVVVAMGGDRQVDNRRLRAHLGVRRYRFATEEELMAQTGLRRGAVPPFGHPVFDLPLYVDADRAATETIVFSLASHTRSVRMATADWLAVAAPRDVFALCKDRGDSPRPA